MDKWKGCANKFAASARTPQDLVVLLVVLGGLLLVGVIQKGDPLRDPVFITIAAA